MNEKQLHSHFKMIKTYVAQLAHSHSKIRFVCSSSNWIALDNSRMVLMLTQEFRKWKLKMWNVFLVKIIKCQSIWQYSVNLQIGEGDIWKWIFFSGDSLCVKQILLKNSPQVKYLFHQMPGYCVYIFNLWII